MKKETIIELVIIVFIFIFIVYMFGIQPYNEMKTFYK